MFRSLAPEYKSRLQGLQLIGFAFLFVTASFPKQAFAADVNILDLSPEQLLGAEVISVSKKAEPVAKAPAAVYVITQEDIARSGVRSVADALRMAPGVDVAQGDANSWAINIRGFNKGLANQLLVLIDGRTIYNTLYGGTYWEVQNLPLEDIAQIEVIRGPGGTVWGANAVNGVINIITKKAKDTQGKLVSMGTGTSERAYALGQTGGKIGEDGYYRIYGQHFNRESFNTEQGDDAGDSSHDSRTGFRYDKGENLTLSGDIYHTVADQLTSVPQFTAPYAVVQADPIKSRGANFLARWKNQFDDGSMLSLQSFVDYTLHDQLTLDDEEDIFDAEAQYNLAPIGRHDIMIGGGYRFSHEHIENTDTISFNPANNNASLFNFFAQDKITLVPDNLFLTLGSKVEHNEDTGYEFEPSARLQWFPDEHQTVWAAASKAIRTPTPLERTIDLNAAVFPPGVVPTEYNLSANPDFQSERLFSYEAGYRNQITPTLSTDIALFYNNYNGIAAQQLVGFSVVFAPPIHLLFQTNQANLMMAETYGGEVALDWEAASNWKISATYSLLKMALHLDNDFTNLQSEEDQSPQQMAGLRSYWNINEHWTLDTSMYYVDRLKAYDVPDYIRADVNLGWRMGEGLQFNLVGQNLLDSSHREFNNATDLNATEIPRTLFGKLTWRF